MVANKSSLFLLKMSEDEAEKDYKIIAGLEAVRVNVNTELVENSNVSSGVWRSLLDESGLKSISIVANGFFKNSEYEELLRAAALLGKKKYFELLFNNGDTITSEFLIGNYERRGTVEDEEIYSFTLNSSGSVVLKKCS